MPMIPKERRKEKEDERIRRQVAAESGREWRRSVESGRERRRSAEIDRERRRAAEIGGEWIVSARIRENLR